jgi:hypothetical protein
VILVEPAKKVELESLPSGMTDELMQAPFKEALAFNRHLGTIRHKNRLHFSFEKVKNNVIIT